MERWMINEREALLIEGIRELTERLLNEKEETNHRSQIYEQLEKALEEYRSARGYKGIHMPLG